MTHHVCDDRVEKLFLRRSRCVADDVIENPPHYFGRGDADARFGVDFRFVRFSVGVGVDVHVFGFIVFDAVLAVGVASFGNFGRFNDVDGAGVQQLLSLKNKYFSVLFFFFDKKIKSASCILIDAIKKASLCLLTTGHYD